MWFFSPFCFFILLLAPTAFYFVDAQLWWVYQVVFQLVVCALGLFVSSWRLLAFIFLVLIICFNLEWLKPSPAPPVCRQRIDQFSGVSKLDSFQFYSALESAKKTGSTFNLKLIKVEMNCRGLISKWPGAEILVTNVKTGGRWFLAGERLEFKNLKLVRVGFGSLLLKSEKKFRIYNVSRQQRILARGPLLLYIQAKARRYLTGFPLGVFKALATADRGSLSKAERERIKRLGIAHIFAISGMHIGILYLGLSFILRWLISFPLGTIRKGYGIIIVDAVVLGFIFIFLNIIRMPISAQRAFIMLLWWAAVRHFIPWQPLSFVFLGTALLILLSQPLAAAQLSFQLSFLSVAGIILILPLLPRRRLRDSFIVVVLKIAVSLGAVSLWLSIFTFPLVHKISPYHSVASAINNVVHISYLSYVFLPVVLAAFIHSAASYALGDLIGEFHLYYLADFLGRLWERLLDWNANWNQRWVWEIEAEFTTLSTLAYWIIWALVSQTLVFWVARRKKKSSPFSKS